MSSEILADENRNFFSEKVTFGKFSTESEIFSETGRKSETEGNASLPLGGWTPLDRVERWLPTAIVITEREQMTAPSISLSLSLCCVSVLSLPIVRLSVCLPVSFHHSAVRHHSSRPPFTLSLYLLCSKL